MQRWSSNDGTINVVVPLDPVGLGGSATFSDGRFAVTALGAPWTLGTAVIATSTIMGFAHGPASGTTTTANPSGVLRLVSPVFVSTGLESVPRVALFGMVELHFVPEPATALLLGSGVAGLAWAARSRLRKDALRRSGR